MPDSPPVCSPGTAELHAGGRLSGVPVHALHAPHPAADGGHACPDGCWHPDGLSSQKIVSPVSGAGTSIPARPPLCPVLLCHPSVSPSRLPDSWTPRRSPGQRVWQMRPWATSGLCEPSPWSSGKRSECRAGVEPKAVAGGRPPQMHLPPPRVPACLLPEGWARLLSQTLWSGAGGVPL